MEQVTITLSEETKAELDEVARHEHAGSRDAAVRRLLDDWLDDER